MSLFLIKILLLSLFSLFSFFLFHVFACLCVSGSTEEKQQLELWQHLWLLSTRLQSGWTLAASSAAAEVLTPWRMKVWAEQKQTHSLIPASRHTFIRLYKLMTVTHWYTTSHQSNWTQIRFHPEENTTLYNIWGIQLNVCQLNSLLLQ